MSTFPHAGSNVERWSEFEEISPEQNRNKNVWVGDGDLFDSSRFSGDATLDRALRRKSESTGGTRHWPEAGADHQGAVPRRRRNDNAVSNRMIHGDGSAVLPKIVIRQSDTDDNGNITGLHLAAVVSLLRHACNHQRLSHGIDGRRDCSGGGRLRG